MTELKSYVGMVVNMGAYQGLLYAIYLDKMTVQLQGLFVGVMGVLFSILFMNIMQSH